MLFLTYIIPFLPFVFVFDGLISAYRTRTPRHISHLANLAAMDIAMEADKIELDEWKWEFGSRIHTFPGGRMSWVIGRKEKSGPEGNRDGTSCVSRSPSPSDEE